MGLEFPARAECSPWQEQPEPDQVVDPGETDRHGGLGLTQGPALRLPGVVWLHRRLTHDREETMRGMTLGLTAMLLLAVGHELDAQSVTPDRVQRQGRMEMHERRELR